VSGTPVWEDGAELRLPWLEGDVDTEVCVVGLGGAGLAAVLELVALGRRVVGLDAGIVGGGASGRNGGFLLAGLPAFYHDAVRAIGRERARRIYRRTLDELDRMTAETPAVIRRTGSLRIATDASEQADCDRQLAAMRADGLPAEPYHGPEGTGLLIPTDGVFDPLARCRALAERARQGGAQLFEHSRVEQLSGTSVRTAHGQLRCRNVIVAVDGRLEQLLPELAGRIRSARLQMLSTAPVDPRFSRPVYRRWSYDYWQQLPDGTVALGGGRDRGGEAEWTTDATPTDAVQRYLDVMLREVVGVDAPVVRRWAAVVGYSGDGLPVVTEARAGVWAAGGYSGTGNILGPACGRGLAQLLVRRSTELLAGIRS
jgi:gamma-glutamylputrescine oxidase